MVKMVHLTIDGIPVTVPRNTSILEAARSVGINVPSLCYLKDLNEIAACRVCVGGNCRHSKLVASATTTSGKAWRSIPTPPGSGRPGGVNVELILSQHNCDCPYCVRSGNCELQKLANDLGLTHLNYHKEIPAARWDNTFPLVRDASKCIKCMRCIQVCDKVQSPEHLGSDQHRFPDHRGRLRGPDHPGSGLRPVRPVHHPLSGGGPAGAGRHQRAF